MVEYSKQQLSVYFVTLPTKICSTMRPTGQLVVNYVIGYFTLRSNLWSAYCNSGVSSLIVMVHLSLVSYNLHGFNHGLPMLRELTNHFDVICVQKHWLSTPQFDRLDSLSSDFVTFNKSAMDHICAADVLHGRPFGSTSIMVHRRFASLLDIRDKFYYCEDL